MRIALAGNPNSGKTTMYNALTGRNEKIGNWAGVTVERKEHPIKKVFCGGIENLVAVDLPGAYSMSPFTSEESITSSYVKNEKPDAIINIVDATNLSRSLFFTTQLLELGIPVVVALNKSDVNKKKQTVIDASALSAKLGCAVVETVSIDNKHDDLQKLIQTAVSLIGNGQKAPYVQGDIDLTDKKVVETADRKRFEFVNKIVKEVETRKVLTKDRNSQDKIDAILTNKWLGIPIFAVVMGLVFFISQHENGLGVWIADLLVGWLETFQEWVGGFVENPLLSAILIDGILGGFIAVVGFLPLVMIMYFMIAMLEDCGYMARVAVVLDPIFKKVGLSGRSVIPFVITTGCAIPGVMASRTIRNERERRATAMLAPFMPCGAKLPVIALFAGVFFDQYNVIVTLSMYLMGILLIFLGALLVNKIAGHKARKSFFIIELPEYKAPSLWGAFKSMCSRGWSYIVKAATIILICNTAVQLMQSFTWSLQFIDYEGIEAGLMEIGAAQAEINAAIAAAAESSILHSIASPIAIVLIPIIGFASWQLMAAAVTGFIAKENVVGTIAICFGITNLISAADMEVTGEAVEVAAALGLTPVAALAYMMFNLFTPPCFAAIGAMNAEIKSKKWLLGGVALQLATGFVVGFLVYQIGTLITTGALGAGFIPGLIFTLLAAAVVTYMILRANKSLKKEYALSGK